MSNPYLGFRTYTESDADRFVGRETEIRQLCEQIKRNQTTVLYANSGIGKSSLINAGLMPELRSEYLPICLRFAEIEDASSFDETIINWLSSPSLLSRLQSSEQFIVLGNRIEASSVNEGSLRFISTIDTTSEDANTILKLVDEEYSKKSLWWFLRTRRLVQISSDGEEKELNPLFIFDQFEELFDKAASFDNSGAFFRWYNNLTSDFLPKGIQIRINELSYFLDSIEQHAETPSFDSTLNSKFLISMRRDYIGQLDYWTYQNEETRNTSLIYNRYYLRPLTEEQAMVIITRRGEDSTLLRWKDQILSCTKENNDGYSTMLLSVICADIYDNGTVYEQIFEYQDEFESLGDYILARIYEKALSASGIKKKRLKIIENDLVDEHGKRRRIYTDDDNYRLSRIKNIDQIVDVLAKQGIVKCTNNSNNKERRLVELAHDRIADVVAKKRKNVKRHQTISTIKGNVALTVIVMAIMTIVGAWVPGVFNLFNSFKSGIYSPSANSHIFYGHSFSYSDLKDLKIKPNNLKQQVETIRIDDDISWVSLNDYPNLGEIIIPKENSSNYLYIKDTINTRKLFNIDCEVIEIRTEIKNCTVQIGPNVKDIQFSSDQNENIDFIISEKNEKHIYDNQILWDKEGHRIVYAQNNADTFLMFPPSFEFDSILVYNNKTFRNIPFYLSREFHPTIKNDKLIKIPKNTKGLVDLSKYSFSSVGDSAFSNCAYVDSIILPVSIQTIGKESFSNCSSLKYTNLNSLKSLSSIGKYAFRNCVSLESIIIPDSCIYLGESFLQNCHSLKYIEFLSNARSIDLSDINKDDDLTIKLPNFINQIILPSRHNNINYIFDKTRGSNLRNECDGLITVWEDSLFRNITDFICNEQWTNFSDSILSKLSNIENCNFSYEDGVLYNNAKIFDEDYKIIVFISKESIHNRIAEKIGSDSWGISFDNTLYIFNNRKEVQLDLSRRTEKTIVFLEQCESLVELHLPFANVERFSSIKGITDNLKSKITLYVPHNCKNEYLKHQFFHDFKEIQEDHPINRTISIFNFYSHSISAFFTSLPYLAILLSILILLVVFIGCRFIVTIYKKKKVPSKKITYKVLFTSVKMLLLATIGFIVCYWFVWIVIFDSINNIPTYITSISLGIIGTFLLPWIWIFSEEFDKKKFKEVLKSSPAAMANWIRKIIFSFVRLIKKIVKIIIKYKKIIVAVITLLASIQTFLNYFCPNDELQHSISNWETTDESTKDSILLELVSIYPKSQSILCSHELSLKYDSIIAAVFDSLVISNKVSYGDTILRDDVSNIYDAENKLIYLSYSDPIARYDIAANKIDTLSIPRRLPNNYYFDSNNSVNCANGNLYYLNETGNDTIEILKLSDRHGKFEQTVIGAIPKDSIVCNISRTRLRVSKEEKYVALFNRSDDFLQIWNLDQKEKIFERQHIYPTSCQFGTDALFFYESYGDSITEVLLSEEVTVHSLLETPILIDMVVTDDNQLLLIYYRNEIGLFNRETKKYNTIFKTKTDFCIKHEDNLYYHVNNSLLKCDISGIPNSKKAEKIKLYLEKNIAL